MSVPQLSAHCPDPRWPELITSYCFGDISEAERLDLEHHLVECDWCWEQVDTLTRHVAILRTDESLRATLRADELVGVFGLSGRLQHAFAGHARFGVLASAAYACLFAVPIFVELAYQFDRFRALSFVLAPLVWLWIFGTSLLAFELDVRRTRRAQPAFALTLALLAAATVLLCATVVPFLPRSATVQATFATYPAHLGYIKSVFYVWMVGPAFLFWPFHFIAVLQRELATRRHAAVLRLLSRDSAAVPPRGTVYLPVWTFVAYLGAIFVLNWLGLSHLFDHLQPAPYKNLFMALVLLRVTIWLALAAFGTWWYAACLTELKRESAAMAAFMSRRDSGPSQ